MSDYSDAADRTPADFFLFALGFLGFMVSATGVIIASVSAAVAGAILLLLVILAFYSRSALSG